jgi:hypothetical protein
MTPFEQEYRWQQQQDRLNAADDQTDSGIPLHVLHSPPPPPPPEEALDLAGMTLEQVVIIAQELPSAACACDATFRPPGPKRSSCVGVNEIGGSILVQPFFGRPLPAVPLFFGLFARNSPSRARASTVPLARHQPRR